jgi:Lyzozyme M1 (1,4-beta-N-acetylmuramidase)
MYKGIDVARYQGLIDWEAVKASGIDFVMIKLGIGTNGKPGDTCELDGNFTDNIEGALAVGLHVGVYLYSYAPNVALARVEAAFTIAQLAPYKDRLTFPVAYDVEDKSQEGLDCEVLSDMVVEFCGALEAAGYYTVLYASLNWLRNRFNMDKITRFDKWVAQYNDVCTYDGAYGMWQYTDAGCVSGITGDVDCNYAYKDYPALISPPKPAEPEKPKDYNPDTDYGILIKSAAETKNYVLAAQLETQRNAKIDGEGLAQSLKTYTYINKLKELKTPTADELYAAGKSPDGRTFMVDWIGPTVIDGDWQHIAGFHAGCKIVTPDGMLQITGGSQGAYEYQEFKLNA